MRFVRSHRLTFSSDRMAKRCQLLAKRQEGLNDDRDDVQNWIRGRNSDGDSDFVAIRVHANERWKRVKKLQSRLNPGHLQAISGRPYGGALSLAVAEANGIAYFFQSVSVKHLCFALKSEH